MGLKLSKNVCNSPKKLAEKFMGTAAGENLSQKAGERIYQSKEFGTRYGAHKIETIGNDTIQIKREIPSGHREFDAYETVISRTYDPKNKSSKTTIPFKSCLDEYAKKIITTVRENGKKTSTTKFKYYDQNIGNSTEVGPVKYYARCAQKVATDAVVSAKNSVIDAFLTLLDR